MPDDDNIVPIRKPKPKPSPLAQLGVMLSTLDATASAAKAAAERHETEIAELRAKVATLERLTRLHEVER